MCSTRLGSPLRNTGLSATVENWRTNYPTNQLTNQSASPMEHGPCRKASSCLASQEIPPCHGTRIVITVYNTWTHFTPFCPISWRSISVLFSHLHLVLPNSFSVRSPYQDPVRIPLHPFWPSFICAVHTSNPLIMQFSLSSSWFLLLGPKSAPVLGNPQPVPFCHSERIMFLYEFFVL
jgi:hypothetical protein